MNLPQWLVDDYTALIDRHLARYRHHVEYEDIRGTAHLNTWRVIARLPRAEQYRAHALVVVNARHAAGQFFRSPGALGRTRNRHGVPLPRPFSLDAILTGDPEEDAPPLPYTRDFVPELIDRLWCAWVFARAREQMAPADWSLVEAWIVRGERQKDIGQRLGIHGNGVGQRLKRLLAALKPLLEATDGGETRSGLLPLSREAPDLKPLGIAL